ncbi:Ig-like domain-containing protein [Diplocloster hominis]|uniref:Ig-like domain-containing protein n=1 Tax=Diplocloster hominis TaxID=3079010 RepID=UPI0031B9D698
MRKKYKSILAGILSAVMVMGTGGTAAAGTKPAQTRAAGGNIVVDYNTSIGTGTPELFGGVGTPAKDQGDAWSKLAGTMGIKLVKVDVDLSALFPDDAETMNTEAYENLTHVAGSILTSVRGAGMKAMLEFTSLPSWLDADGNGMYDSGKADDYKKMIRRFLGDAKGGYEDIISHVEIAPDAGLSDADFTEMYYTTAREVRAVLPAVTIGGFGYSLTDKNDTLPANVKAALSRNKAESDQTLLQYVSVRGYSAEPTDGNSPKDLFGEFKAGRKAIRNALSNQDLPLYMTGWSTAARGASSADSKITGTDGIKYHTSALFKAMRDGWDVVLFDGTVSSADQPGSYTYTLDADNKAALNPFAKVYNLLGNKLGLNAGEFKVVSTDMGNNWPVDDSIAMVNSQNEAIMLLTNFSSAKSNVGIELKNVPYEDGAVELELYVASADDDGSAVQQTVNAQVTNGIITAAIPSIPADCAMGLVVKGGNQKSLPAQTMYEFESQDNHFGGNMEIGWTTGASFNRTVSGFGGADNFVTLRKVAADGAGTYTAHLYAANRNSNIMVSVNGNTAFPVDGSGISLSQPVDFEVTLEAGSGNTIQVYTSGGELKPDRLVLEAKNVQLSIGLQNLYQLDKLADGSYVLPLKKTDFTVDARIFPEASGTGRKISFASSDPAVAEVNPDTGLITPKTIGKCTITAKIEGTTPAVTNSFDVTVKNAVSSVTVTPAALTMKQGNTSVLEAEISPADAENKNITWTSSNPAIVEITAQDNVSASIRAVAESGTATITATTEDGKKTAGCTVTVVKPVPGGSVNIDYGNTISTGHPGIFGVTHYPSVNTKDSDIGDHSQVWPMLTDQAGVRFMRADARLQEILPIWTKTPDTNWEKPASYNPDQPNYVKSDYYYVTGPDGQKRKFTLEGYQEDMKYYQEHGKYLNGLSDPKNWNTDRLMSWVDAANAQNYEVMVMTFQIPEWLSAGEVGWGDPHTKKVCNGAPKDWTVYRDIVKKVYLMLRDKIDYYEFLNEPHWYIPTHGDQRDPDGVPYTGGNIVNNIAADQFYQAIDAIYEAEAELTGNPDAKPKVKLGGGADDSWGGDYGVLGTLFSDKYRKWIDRIEFVSIHKYGERPANQDDSNGGANSRNLKFWLREKTGKDIPLFLNEYNISTGQPTAETYGYKSVGWHAKNLIDMMVDGYTGGGYYTCYPADVPMDDYEASSGWVERGKGMYTWNNGDPYLANFTRTWGMLSVKLGLGDGDYAVKSTDINGSMSHAIGAVNTAGDAVAFINNYSAKSYDNVSVNMKNVPYTAGSKVTATIYRTTYDTEEAPLTVEASVAADGSVTLEIPEIPSWAVAGIVLSGTQEQKEDKTYEFESYQNTLSGTAKINKESNASNGRLVTGASGETNSVTIPVGKDSAGMTKLELNYAADTDSTLTYVIGEQVKTVNLPAKALVPSAKAADPAAAQAKAEIMETLPAGKTAIRFYVSQGEASLDSIVRYDIDKKALQALVDQPFTEDGYTDKSWEAYAAARAEAIRVLKDDGAAAQEVQDAYEALSNAIDNLVLMVNLGELVTAMEGKLPQIGDYSTASWSAFAVSLNRARNVLADTQATQEEQIKAYRNLEAAANGLVSVSQDVNKSLIEGKMPASNTTITRPEKATDGDTGTSDSGENFTQLAAGEEIGGSDNGYSTWEDVYLQYDFGAEYLVNKVDVYRTIYNGGGYIRWKNCKVELSTDADFAEGTVTVLASDETLQTDAGQTAPQDLTVDPPVKARYIRVSGRGHQGSWGGYSNKVNFSEIQVFGTFVPTKDELSASLDAAKALDKNDYTANTWNALEALFPDTEDVIKKDGATQAEINEAAANLAMAVDGLRKKADTNALKEQIKNLSDKMALPGWNLLGAAQQQIYDDLLTEATNLLNDGEALQTDVDNMKTKVENGVRDLAELYRQAEEEAAKEAQRQILSDYIAQVGGTDLSSYTADSAQAFRNALQSAKDTLAAGTTKGEFRSAYENLKAAYDGLTKPAPEDPDRQVQRDSLKLEIGEAQIIEPMGYTEESVQALRNTLAAVQRVLDDPASTTEDLKDARRQLNAAVAGLIKKGPDRNEYKKSIADEIALAEAKDLKGYTAQSVQAFKDALIYAKAVLNNQEASEADYKEALAKLKDASAALRKPDQDKPDNNKDQNKDSGGGLGDSISQAANTGDPAQPMILAVIMIISLAAGMVLLVRKRRREE